MYASPVEARHPIGALQLLRALAALMVVVWHSHLAIKYALHDYWPEGDAAFRAQHYPSVLNHLDLGVDLFFCISGFIMSLLIRDLHATGADARRFLLQRAIRIFPPYWVFTLLVVFAFVASRGSLNVGALSGQGASDGRRLLASLLLLPQSQAPILGVGWTLIHEALFYLLCCFVLRSGLQHRLPEVLATLSALALCLAWQRIQLLDGYLFSPFTLEFLCGALAYRLLPFAGSRPLLLLAAALAGYCVLARVLDRPDDGLLRPMWRALGGGGIGLLLVLGAIGADERHAVCRTRCAQVLIRVGDASYLLYLSHWFILSALGRVLAWMPSMPVFAVAGWHLISIAAAVTVAVVLAEQLELPFHRVLKRSLAGSGRPAPT